MANQPDESVGQTETASPTYGAATAKMVNSIFAEGVDRCVLLLRHSAREYRRDVHDLVNPLTDEGRVLARQFGQALPDVALRGYSSPAGRCIETAECAFVGAMSREGFSSNVLAKVRPLESLGVFYALDQIRMWKGLSQSQGLAAYVRSWFDQQIPRAVMMNPYRAVAMLLDTLVDKLDASPLQSATRQLDLCVSHDMTVFTVRHGVGLQSVEEQPVNFLDGLALFRQDGQLVMCSQYGSRVVITDHLLAHSQ